MTKNQAKKDSSKIDRGTQYAHAVVDGDIIAGPYVRGACQRHLNDLEHAGERGFYYDEHEASETIAFFEECLCLNGGQFEGLPFILDPWQCFVIGSIFGWKQKKDGFRRFRLAYIETAKGSGKSPLASGIGIKGLMSDKEPRAEVYACATFKDQAMVLFRDAIAFYDQSPELQKRLVASGVGDNRWKLANHSTGSFFSVIASDNKKGKSGPRPHMYIADEVHEHSDGNVIGMLEKGFKFRRQPLGVEITNPLALDTKIATPDGWVLMGDIKIGDKVFNEKGLPCSVTNVSRVIVPEQCYKIIFDNKSEIICDGNHSWETTINNPFGTRKKQSIAMTSNVLLNKKRRTAGELNPIVECQCGCGNKIYSYDAVGRPRRYVSGHNNIKTNKTSVRSTLQIKSTLYSKSGGANHKIILTKPLCLPDQKLPIPPYTLGCWLGDGNSKDAAIVVANGELEILDNICNEGISVGRKRSILSSGNNIGLYGIGVVGTGKTGSLQTILRKHNLLNNKHIPSIYLRASYSQRLALLQGLMDTDGCIVQNTGRCVFTQSKHALILQVKELITSLGIKCRLRHDISILNGKPFDRWDIFFIPPENIKVFKLKRKLKYSYQRGSRKRNVEHSWIKEIKNVESVPVRCISVDSDSHLFLAGESMIPTHNSGHDVTSFCWERHEMGRKVATGMENNDTVFAYICALDDEDLINDAYLENEAVWGKVNPSLEVSGIPGYDYIRKQVANARGMSSQLASVKRLNFCVWTEAENPWISGEIWNPLMDKDFDESLLSGRRCWGGLDQAAVNDLASYDLIFEPTPDDPFWRLKSFFWMPGDNIRRKSEIDHVPYDVWVRFKHIFACPGPTISKTQIIKWIYETSLIYDIQGVAYDRDRMADLIEFAVKAEIDIAIGKWDKEKRVWFFNNSYGVKMMPFGQTAKSMSPAIEKFETLLLNKEIRHNGNPVQTWCIANAVVKDDDEDGYRKISKRKSIGRVDGAITAVMACGISEKSEGTTQSAYEGMTEDQMKSRMAF